LYVHQRRKTPVSPAAINGPKKTGESGAGQLTEFLENLYHRFHAQDESL